jgi:hypothetical protein
VHPERFAPGFLKRQFQWALLALFASHALQLRPRPMFRIVSLSCAGFALLIGVSLSAGPANAVVYCKTVGVPN